MLDEHPQYSVLSLENVECCWGRGEGGAAKLFTANSHCYYLLQT